jgi:hypothetical protein
LGRRDPSPERTLLLRRRSYGLMRRSRWALSSFGFLASFGESLQVVTSPCCPRQLPDVISNSLFLDAGSPSPAVHRVLAPVSSTVPSAFPTEKWVGLPQLSRLKRLRAGGGFRGCRYFVMFRPPSLLAPQIVPTAANTPAGQPGLLRPSRTRFVASPRIGYANRPKTGNWRCRDLHPARLRPCRLLLSILPPKSRVEDWRAGLGRSLCSPLSRSFVCECHSISTMPTFPVPATSNAVCGFPALRSPACFTSRVMGPILLGRLSTAVA